MKKAVLLSAFLALAPVFAYAEDGADVVVYRAEGAAGAAAKMTISADVTAIDAATRTLTLKGPKGNEVFVTAGSDVQNFDQIKVGDKVRVRYVQALTLELKKTAPGVRSRVETADAAKAEAGDAPAAIAGRKVQVVADVVQVNKKAQTVLLKGAKRTLELKVHDKQALSKLKAGDQVEATYVEAVAVNVEPAAAK